MADWKASGIFMTRLSAGFQRLFEGAAMIGAFALIGIALMISSDVFIRWLTGRPLIGVFEFSGILLVIVTFLPLALVLFTNQQLRIDIIHQYASGKAAAALGLLDAAIGILVFGLLLWIGTEETLKAYQGRFLLRGMIEIPTWIPNIMICIGTALAVLALIIQAAEYLLRIAGFNLGQDDIKIDGDNS
jgi:TRAP-type C4-dicarboxylate transport system permease small subunit